MSLCHIAKLDVERLKQQDLERITYKKLPVAKILLLITVLTIPARGNSCLMGVRFGESG